MKLHWSNKAGLLAGLAIVVVTNAIALGGVSYNRSGEPESTLVLTERELPIAYWSWPDNDNSGIDLQLNYRVRQSVCRASEGYWQDDWLDEEQLQALGFDTSIAVDAEQAWESSRKARSKAVFLVLEYDGPAYRAELEACRKRVLEVEAQTARNVGDERSEELLKSAREALAREEESASRLFVVDAGLDPGLLRNRYADRERYSIVRGRVRTYVAGEPGRERIAAYPPDLEVDQIRVPHAYRTLVEPLRERRGYGYIYNQSPPRFSATVSFGRRFEPWIAQMQGEGDPEA